MLKKAGFELVPKRGKGSHTIWKHPKYNGTITLSGKDSKVAGKYQERDINRAIKEVESDG